MIIKKGYYVVSVETLQVVSGPQAIPTPEEAESEWKRISKSTPGSEKFFILWSPHDNYAWGE